MQIHFSIITPLYNSEHFIAETIASVLNQTCPDWEMIIVDDGSTDDSLRIAREWANKDNRIKVLQHENAGNKGVSAARNLGIKHSEGLWLAMLDADDKWLPDKLQNDKGFLDRHSDAVLLFSKAEVIDENGLSVLKSGSKSLLNRKPVFGHGPAKMSSFKEAIKARWGVPTSSTVFFKSAGYPYGFFDETTGDVEDFLLWYQLSEQGTVYFRDEMNTQYRIHNNSWNAENKDYKKLIPRRQKMYRYLLHSVTIQNRNYVSKKLVVEGFKIVLRSCLVTPHHDTQIVKKSFLSILNDNKVHFKYKAFSIFILLREIFFIPLKMIKRIA